MHVYMFVTFTFTEVLQSEDLIVLAVKIYETTMFMISAEYKSEQSIYGYCRQSKKFKLKNNFEWLVEQNKNYILRIIENVPLLWWLSDNHDDN